MKEEILDKGEKMFLPINEESDKECYKINNIENWAESFYNLKSGIILERYKQIMAKSEYAKFFEGLNYEYGINNYPLDTTKAFQIYKTAAETSTDTLSMFRLYRIYKKDFKKFNIEKRNFVLEKFYIMKCFTYLTDRERIDNFYLCGRFNIEGELVNNIKNKSTKKLFKWFSEYFIFLSKNQEIYNISNDEIILVENVIGYVFKYHSLKYFVNNLTKLEEKGHPVAIYNLGLYNKQERPYYAKIHEKLYNLNYYRSFSNYAIFLGYGRDALNIIRKSLTNGYFLHIKIYKEIFFMINEFEDIFKSPQLKQELLFIFSSLMDAIIADELDLLLEFIYMRKIMIKHFNFGNELKGNFDFYTKEILDYLMKFTKGTDDENKTILIKYYINNDFYLELYTKLCYIYYYGVSGIIDRNYDKAINQCEYLLKNKDILYDERFVRYVIYLAKCKQRKLGKIEDKKQDSNEKEKINNENDLIELEKKLINMFYEIFTEDTIKIYPPSLFFILSKFYSSTSVNNQDMILEYVLLNRAANAPLLHLDNISYDYFQEKYLKYKAKKKLEEKNKEEYYKKLKESKGIINVEGYGEDGTICPICFTNKKSVICLPCKHFFCKPCLDKLIGKSDCPICRTQIKIIFDFESKKEKLIKTIIKHNDG